MRESPTFWEKVVAIETELANQRDTHRNEVLANAQGVTTSPDG